MIIYNRGLFTSFFIFFNPWAIKFSMRWLAIIITLVLSILGLPSIFAFASFLSFNSSNKFIWLIFNPIFRNFFLQFSIVQISLNIFLWVMLSLIQNNSIQFIKITLNKYTFKPTNSVQTLLQIYLIGEGFTYIKTLKLIL